MSRACKLASVVSKPARSVFVCEHGLLHVAVGSMTLRLSSEALEPIVAVLNEALSELQRADAALHDCH